MSTHAATRRLMPLEFSTQSLKEKQQSANVHRCPWCGEWTPRARGIFCPPCWRGMPAQGQETVRFNLSIHSPTSARRFGMQALREAADDGTFHRVKFVRAESEVES